MCNIADGNGSGNGQKGVHLGGNVQHPFTHHSLCTLFITLTIFGVLYRSYAPTPASPGYTFKLQTSCLSK